MNACQSLTIEFRTSAIKCRAYCSWSCTLEACSVRAVSSGCSSRRYGGYTLCSFKKRNISIGGNGNSVELHAHARAPGYVYGCRRNTVECQVIVRSRTDVRANSAGVAPWVLLAHVCLAGTRFQWAMALCESPSLSRILRSLWKVGIDTLPAPALFPADVSSACFLILNSN